MRLLAPVALLCFLRLAMPASAQRWDLGSRLGEYILTETGGKLRLAFESRGRYELRRGQGFGRDPSYDTGLIRTRLGLSVRPVRWLKLSGMVQDSRAPWSGAGAPTTLRHEADLHEAYFELFPDRKTGFGATAGRMVLNYGESRLIGTAQWNNVSRTFDHARAYWRARKARLELLLISPISIRAGAPNKASYGERVWGTYNSFPDAVGKSLVELYALRHDQNRPGGFAGGNKADGTDRLGVNTFGGRIGGPLRSNLKYSIEGAVQTGKVGPARHRAGAWFSALTRRWTFAAIPLDITGEYKYASGTNNPARSNTFDQLYPTNHDKFGHQDLFGWRNIHNARSLATLGVTKGLALNLMYNSVWLACTRDALYSAAGKAIARSAPGTAGRHVGQEGDIFVTFRYNHFTVGSGYGYFFKGEFVRNTTPGARPVYAYLFHQYSF